MSAKDKDSEVFSYF